MEVEETIDVVVPVKPQNNGGSDLQKYYGYLKSKGADVPPTFDSFRKTLQDEQSARKYYDYVKKSGYDAPPTYESFANTLGLKKKETATPQVSTKDSPTTVSPLKNGAQSVPDGNSPKQPNFSPVGQLLGGGTDESKVGGLGLPQVPKLLPNTSPDATQPNVHAEYSWNRPAKVIGHSDIPEPTKEEIQKEVDDAYNAMPPVAKQGAIMGVKAWNGAVDVLNNTVQFLDGTAFGLGSKELKNQTNEYFDNLKQVEPTAEKGITVNNVVGSMGSMIPFIASFATGAGELSAAAKVAGASDMAATTIGTVGTNMVLGYNQAYDEATSAGVKSELAKNEYATGVTALGGMLFAAMPALQQVRGFGSPTELGKYGSEVLAKSLAEGNSVKAATNQALKAVTKTVIDNAENAGIMTGVELTTKLNQAVSNASTGQHNFDASIDPKEIGEHLILNSLTLMPLSAIKGVGAYAEKNTMQKQAIYEAAKDPEKYKGLLQKQLEDGKINLEQYANANLLISDVSGAIDKMPRGYSEPKRMQLVQPMLKKDEAKDEVTTLQTEKATVDENFHPEIDKKIKTAEKKVDESDKEIKFILDSKDKSEPIDLPVKEDFEAKRKKINDDFNEALNKLAIDYTKPESYTNEKQQIADRMKLYEEHNKKLEALAKEERDSKLSPEQKAEKQSIINQMEEDLKSSQPKTENDATEKGKIEVNDQSEHKGTNVNRTTTETSNSDSNAPSGKIKTEEKVTLEEPSLEQQIKELKNKETVTFKYKSKSEVPEIFKDKITSEGEINGEPFVRVTMAKSLADYHLKKLEQDNQPKDTPKESIKEEVVPESQTTDTRQQLEEFGVPKEDVEATHGLLNQVFSGLKKAGLTAAKTVGDWVGIGKGSEKPYSLKIGDKEVQVKNTQPEVVNGFYSPLEKVITDSKFDKLPAKQWAEKYANSEEAKWTGLKDWLAQQQGSVSKADIQQFLKDNRIQVVEVVKGEVSNFTKDDIADVKINQHGAGNWVVKTKKDGTVEFPLDKADDKAEAIEYALEQLNYDNKSKRESKPKFAQYQLGGEKSNYKEVLVTMPVAKSKQEYVVEQDYRTPNTFYAVNQKTGVKLKFGSYELAKSQAERLSKESQPDFDKQFKSSHFDEPNILVHLRMNTRTDADGKKVLFLEEVQSDWGQKGKKEGFDSEKNDYKAIADRFAKGLGFTQGSEADVKLALKRIKQKSNIWEREYAAFKEAGFSDAEINKMAADYTDGLTPSAPFVTDTNSWTKLGLKVALKEAVKQGADKIAWSTGTQQFDRWGSEEIHWNTVMKPKGFEIVVKDDAKRPIVRGSRIKSLSSNDGSQNQQAEVKRLAEKWNLKPEDLEVIPSKGQWTLAINEQTDAQAFQGNEEALRSNKLEESDISVGTKAELRDAIKRNLSRERNDAEIDKLTDRIWNRMQTEDSGTSLPRKEGMEEFYGNPKDMERAKDFTVKKEGDVFAVKDEKGKTIRTFKQENEANKFKENYGLGIVGNVAKSLFKQVPKTVDIFQSDKLASGWSVTVKDKQGYVSTQMFDSKSKGLAWLSEQEGLEVLSSDAEGKNYSTQHSIDITHELRASVEGGQPLFKDAEAQYRIESGKNIIEAIKDFNKSKNKSKATVAITHEIMHPTVVSIIDGAKDGNEVGKKHTQTIVDEYNKAKKSNVTAEQLIKDNDAFKQGKTTDSYRDVQEFIAESWEKYHKEGGKGFSEAFQKVLDQITQSFRSVYKSISGKELTPELRKMFDDILGKEESDRIEKEREAAIKKATKESTSDDDLVTRSKEIHAKYDAEIKALEEGNPKTTTNEKTSTDSTTEAKGEYVKKRLSKKDFDLNDSPLNGLNNDNASAIVYLNEYPDKFTGIEDVDGATKITGVTNNGNPKIEKVNEHSIGLNFGDTQKTMHFKSEDAKNSAIDLIYEHTKPKQEVKTESKESSSKTIAKEGEVSGGNVELSKEEKAAEFVKLPIAKVKKALKDFQGRTADYSKTTYDSIVGEAKDGTLNISSIPAIQIWGETGELLAGHSRVKAFEDLASGKLPLNEKYKPSDFENINTQIVDAKTREEAKRIAERSNSGAQQTPFENSKILARMRREGATKGAIDKEASRLAQHGDKKHTLNLSNLSEDGKASLTLAAAEKTPEKIGKERTEAIRLAADKAGEMRGEFPELTKLHEDEIFDALINGKVKASEVEARVNRVVNSAAEPFNPSNKLNIESVAHISPEEMIFQQRTADLRKEIKDLQRSIKKDAETKLTPIEQDYLERAIALNNGSEPLGRKEFESEKTKNLIAKKTDEAKALLKRRQEDLQNHLISKKNLSGAPSLFDVVNTEIKNKTITNEQANRFIEATEDVAKDETVITNLESKEKSATEVSELKEIVKAADELIKNSKEEVKPELPKSESPKTYTEKAKKVEEQPKTKLQLAKERVAEAKKKVNDAYGKLGIDPFEQRKRQALADRELFDSYLDVAREAINEGVKTIADFAKELGEEINDHIKRAWDVATDKKKYADVVKEITDIGKKEIGEEVTQVYNNEKSIIKHLVESENISEAAANKLKEQGLKYDPHSHEEARELATEIVKGVGEDAAVTYAESNRFSGDVNSSIFAVSIDKVAERERLLREKGDTKKADFLAEKWADFSIRYDAAARDGGRFISQIYDWYKKSPLGIRIKEQKIIEKKFTDWFKEKEDAYKEFWEEVQKQPEFKEAVTAEVEKVNNKKKAKVIADKLRKGKIDNDIMMAGVPFVKEVWNGAIEAAAKVIELGGSAADIAEKALKAGLQHIKDSDWYKGLDAEYKAKAEKRFEEHFSEAQKEGLTKEEKRIKELEDSIKKYDEKIAELEEKGTVAAKEKKVESEAVENLKKAREEKRKEFEKLKREKLGLTKPVEDKIVKKWSDKLKGLPTEKREAFIRDIVKAIVLKGELKYPDFKKILAEAIGLGKITKEQGKLIDEYAKAANDVTELGNIAQEEGTPESIKAYEDAVKIAERKATDLANNLHQDVNITSRLTSLVSLNTLGFGTLLKNIGYNVAQQALIRFPKALIGTAVDYTAYGVSLAANRVYGTPILKPETNVFLAQRGYFSSLGKGIKDALQKIKRGGTQKDYFQAGIQQARIKPIKSWMDLSAWKFGKGDKFLTNREVIDKVLQGTFGVSGEIISRGLFMGDTPARWAAEGARAEQIARLTLGLKSRKDIELFKMFPEQQAKKIFLKRGLSEEKAQAKAEDIKRQLQEAGDDATLTMENMLVSAINNIKKYSDAASKESSMGNMANTIGRFAGVLNVPYLKIPVNAAWLAMNIKNPLLALSQSMIFGYDGIKNGNRASLRKSKDWLYIAGVGVAVNTVAAWMANNGIVTPKGTDDDSKKEGAVTNEYDKQFSMNINNLLRGGGVAKDGDVSIDLSWFGSFGAATNTAAQLTKEERARQLSVGDEMLFNLSQGGIDGFTNNVFGGTNALINAYTRGGGYVNQLGLQYFNLMGNVLEPAMISQISKYGMNGQLEIKGNTFGEALSKDIYERSFGVLGKKPEKKLGIFGEPQEKGGSYFGRVARGLTGTEVIDTDKMGYVIYDMYNKTNNADLIPPSIPKTITVDGKAKTLNYEQQRELTKLIGSSRFELVGAFLEGKAAIMVGNKNQYIDNIKTDEVAKYLKKMYDKGGDLGRARFKALHPEFNSKKDEDTDVDTIEEIEEIGN